MNRLWKKQERLEVKTSSLFLLFFDTDTERRTLDDNQIS